MVTGLTKVWAGVNDTVTELATAGASLPSGLIAIWKGSTSTIPDGWALCNGQNGTPDLRDRFVLGAGSGYSVGNRGGEANHTLSTSEIPSHTHTLSGSGSLPISDNGNGPSGSEYLYVAYYDTKSRGKYSFDNILINGSAGYTGGNLAHNNMPPYYALCYIMKT